MSLILNSLTSFQPIRMYMHPCCIMLLTSFSSLMFASRYLFLPFTSEKQNKIKDSSCSIHCYKLHKNNYNEKLSQDVRYQGSVNFIVDQPKDIGAVRYRFSEYATLTTLIVTEVLINSHRKLLYIRWKTMHVKRKVSLERII